MARARVNDGREGTGAAKPRRDELRRVAVPRVRPKASPKASAKTSPKAALEAAELEAARIRELEEKAAALESANRELRSLTANLDQIVRQRTRALAESESQLRRKNVELERLNRLREEFISIAAHELRTPMTSIVGYLDLFSQRPPAELGAETRRQLGIVRRNAHRLRRLVEDMLDVSRLETGVLAIRRAPTSVAEVVRAVIEEVRPIAGAQRTIQTEITEIPPIDADPDRIHQVLSNIVINALKFTSETGDVRIIVDRAVANGVDHARVRVWDNGRGIPLARRQSVFEPFSEMAGVKHHTSNQLDSAGLGLRIARGIIQLHGGSISVDSEEGRFTEMTVLLPFA